MREGLGIEDGFMLDSTCYDEAADEPHKRTIIIRCEVTNLSAFTELLSELQEYQPPNGVTMAPATSELGWD